MDGQGKKTLSVRSQTAAGPHIFLPLRIKKTGISIVTVSHWPAFSSTLHHGLRYAG